MVGSHSGQYRWRAPSTWRYARGVDLACILQRVKLHLRVLDIKPKKGTLGSIFVSTAN